MHRRALIGSAAAASLLAGASRAQAFPSKQLRFLVGFAAGGGGGRPAATRSKAELDDDIPF